MQSPPGFVFAVPAVGVPVAGRDRHYAVRRIYCVGRNYASHIREMGGNEREAPFFFQKPTDAVVLSGATIAYPPATDNFQHEIELVLAIGRQGRSVSSADAHHYIFGVAVGIDLTRRDLQFKARDSGRPWESGKSFDQSAPISAIHERIDKSLPDTGRISLSVNGKLKQEGDLTEMIWKAGEIVAQLSELYTLQPGDLIYTGTPQGVGPLNKGDRVEGAIEGIDSIQITIGAD